MRDYKLYLRDIFQAILKIEKYTKGVSFRQLKNKDLIVDGVIRNLEIIGEASKNIPLHVKKSSPDVEWKRISGLRDILIHEYFGIDIDILWDIVKNKLPDLKKRVYELLNEQ